MAPSRKIPANDAQHRNNEEETQKEDKGTVGTASTCGERFGIWHVPE